MTNKGFMGHVSPVREAIEVVMVVEIVCGELFAHLDVSDGSAGKPEPVCGETYRIGSAGVIDYRCYWE